MKKILFSVGLRLKPAQEFQLARLFKGLRGEGYIVLVIGDGGSSDIFGDFFLQRPYEPLSLTRKVANFLLSYKLYYFGGFDHQKWKARYKIWSRDYSKPDNEASKYMNAFKNSVYILNNISPDYFFCWNPLGCSYGFMYDLSPVFKIKRKSIESGLLPQSIVFDNNGINTKSELMDICVEKLQQFSYVSEFNGYGERLIEFLKLQSTSLYRQSELTPKIRELLENQKSKQKILFLGCSEVATGIVPYNHEEREVYLPFFSSNIDLVNYVSQIFPDAFVVYKPHPAFERSKENKALSSNSWILHVDPEELIKWADVVICAGTKMELSVLLQNKPLVLSGTGLLFNKGCAYEVDVKENFKKTLEQAVQQKVTKEQQQNLSVFLGYLYRQRLLVPDLLGDGAKSEYAVNNFAATYLN